MTKFWARVVKSEFTRNVSSQMMGTGIAQILPFLATPLLTRLYSESDFASYTSFFALATIFAVGVGGKYHMAIVLPRSELRAMRLFALSIYLTLAYAIILQLAFFGYYRYFPSDLGALIYFVPLYVLFFGIWSAFTNLSIRHKTFRYNAYAKVMQAIGYIGTALGFGFARITIYGLVLAKILGTLGSWLYLFKKSGIRASFIPIRKLKEVAIEYKDFPKFGIGPSLLNTVSMQALILVLTAFYSKDDLGYYGLTYMVLSAPLGLIGTSYKDVFYQKIADLVNQQRYKECKTFFLKSALVLFSMGTVIGIVLFLFGPFVFSIVFGDSWIRSGNFASILAFSFVFKLVASPLSAIFNATNDLKIASVWQFGYFITTFITLGCCVYLFDLDIISLLYVYVIHEVILYSLYFLLEYKTLAKLSVADN
ncbi:lipopolysaccharide biosynthesis protein [Zeaxanthinibacter sp. PT1]|uniref:lipopolysaccharide biosynthesis protein n=1 Tax=Zeaxanthinibacter TaxID=561554 RepID=UPI00234948BB|nr:lipopolysaccharide biosynthesis protein [Zeaxanthinibacter sp. PT1]MDC6350612.1 lipopolysaccharide biosynthesis protein [Zeaxanthinibacter sp. PT1]